MNPQTWWYLSRASGIVAWAVLAASVLWGLALSTKFVQRRGIGPWLTDLHRFLGALSVLFTVAHLAGLVADNYVHFGARELLVPMASSWKPGPVTWGVVALYLLVAIEVTSLAMKRLPRRLWRHVHRSSFVLFWVASWHAVVAGTDVPNPAYRWAAIAVTAAVMFLTLFRVLLPGRGSVAPAAGR